MNATVPATTTTGRDMDERNLDGLITQLRDRKAYLESSLDRIESELDAEPSKDFEERASEREGDEVLEGLGAAELNELRQIRAALGRVEAGTYGECVNCGNPISEKRLAAVPHTPLCIDCASRG